MNGFLFWLQIRILLRLLSLQHGAFVVVLYYLGRSMNYKMGPLRLEDEPIDWLSLQAAVDVFDWEHGNVPRENLLQILFRQKEREPWVHDELVSACLHKHSGDPAISHFMQSAE